MYTRNTHVMVMGVLHLSQSVSKIDKFLKSCSRENRKHFEHVWHRPSLASFPGPAQLPITCSMVKRERAWYIFSTGH